MSEATHELVKDEETGKFVEVPKAKEDSDKPARVWFPDEEGYRGKPLEYDGQRFYVVSAKKSALRRYLRVAEQEIPRKQKQVAAEQKAELKVLQDAARKDARALAEAEKREVTREELEHAASLVELSQERIEYYEAEGEKLSEMLENSYDELLSLSVVGWSLPRPFSLELLKSFDIADKAELCTRIGQRSVSGFSAVKN